MRGRRREGGRDLGPPLGSGESGGEAVWACACLRPEEVGPTRRACGAEAEGEEELAHPGAILGRGGEGEAPPRRAAGPALGAGGPLHRRASANSGALGGGDVRLLFTKQALGRRVQSRTAQGTRGPGGLPALSGGHFPGSLRRRSLAACRPRPGEA